MQYHRLIGVLPALVCSTVLIVPSAQVRAAQSGIYLEASAGVTRTAATIVGGVLATDPGTDLALGVAFGTSLSENTRVEAELGYAKAVWDLGDGHDLRADGFNLGANYLFDFGADSSAAKFEVGIGLGWTFFDEACIEGFSANYCVDADLDDWNVQGIVGGSYAISDTGAITARYRMQNIGGFSSDDRIHVFTVGYRHFF